MPAIETTPAKPRVRIRTDGTIVGLPQQLGSPSPRSGFMRSNSLPMLFRWNPALRDANDDIKASWRQATARTVEELQNSGWLAGAVEQSSAHVVGPNGLQLNAKPNADALGWDQQQANEWARLVEARFSLWASNPWTCDASASFTFGELQNQAYEHWMATGEVLAALPFEKRPGSMWGTKLHLLPAWRLSETSDLSRNIEQGVQLDIRGAPIGYLIKQRPLGRVYLEGNETLFPATERYGRKNIVHIFRGTPAQVRGITPFVSVLKVTRQFDQLADATLTAALIQTVFAAMFKSQAPSDDVLAGMQSAHEQANAIAALSVNRVEWYENADFDLGQHGKILHGYPGDELQMFRSEHPNDTYEPFAKFLLREISRASALTYEEFSGDYAGATFSSVKMGVAATWPRIERRRNAIAARLCQDVYESWLEEDIEAGGTPFPGGVAAFLQQREAAARANWRGPNRPAPDELKAANAAKTNKEIGVPDQVMFDDMGLDVDEVYEQLAREKQRREELGIEPEPPPPPAGFSSEDPTDEPEEEPDDNGRRSRTD